MTDTPKGMPGPYTPNDAGATPEALDSLGAALQGALQGKKKHDPLHRALTGQQADQAAAPPAPGAPVALNSPALEQTLAAALGADMTDDHTF